MSWHNLVNTHYFCEGATDFFKNGGSYTLAPRGSKEYLEYWTIQHNRCLNGLKIGDTWIPGRMYFYLNFFPMWRVDTKVALQAFKENKDRKGKVSRRIAEKVLGFPKFTELQYEWWRFKHIAWYGGTFMGISSEGGKHICCAKTRRAGFSYMEAADGVYNYNFLEGSKSYYFASNQNYLIQDGILNKVQEGLDWINTHIPFWKQNRQKKNTLMHQRASFIDTSGLEQGTLAEIMGVIVDDPNKTRGKSGRKITFEEAGSFPKLKEALEISMGSVSDGDFYTGQISVFGTGGESGVSIEGLEDIFYNPHKWDMLAFPNIWEYGTDTCGYFVPCYRANFLYYDENGNCDMDNAILADDREREKKMLSKNIKDLDRRKAEFPRVPSEAFQRIVGNGFNIAEIDRQIQRIENDSSIKNMIRYGDLVVSNNADAINGIEFVPKTQMDAKPILHYPHNAYGGDDLTGCVTICQPPMQDKKGQVPAGMYMICADPYSKDNAENVTSLFAAYVFKLDNMIDSQFYNLPVAWYVGRPLKLDICYDIMFNLAKYYNATIQSEIGGGGQGIITYAQQKRLMHFLEFEPEMLHNKEIASKQRNRSYFMNMTKDRKSMGMSYLESWHMHERGQDEHGNPIYNIHKIYDIALLKEMRKASSGLNADRISACIIAMFMIQENYAVVQKRRGKASDFFSRSLFAEEQGQEFTSFF